MKLDISGDEQQIRDLIAEQHRAVCHKDVSAILRHYSEDAVIFSEAAVLDTRSTRLAPHLGDVAGSFSRFLRYGNSGHGDCGERRFGNRPLPLTFHRSSRPPALDA